MDMKAAQLESDHGIKLIHRLGWYSRSPVSPAELSQIQTDSLATATGTAADCTTGHFPKIGSQIFRAAEKRLRKKTNRAEGPVKVVPIPEGEPMFMFQALKGRTAPVNAFYDSGCSNACLRDGIPGVQLKGQMLAKGPFTVGGVNATQIQ